MSRRRAFADLILPIIDGARGAPVSLQILYEAAERDLPREIATAPSSTKWKNDLRWEIESAVVRGDIVRRPELGRGYYSSGRHPDVSSDADPTAIQIMDVEVHSTETFRVSPLGEREAVRSEAALIDRYRRWSNRAFSRAVITTSEGDRLVTDLYDVRRNLVIEAKASTTRPHVRMAIGQLLDYAQGLGGDPHLAVLIPHPPPGSLIRLLSATGIGTISESSHGGFVESLTER